MLGGILAGLAAGALWGLVFVAPSLVPSLSAIDLVAGRFVSYALGSLLAMAVSRRARFLPTSGQAGMALGLSVLGFSGYYWLLVLAIRDVGVEVPVLMIGTLPVWVMLLGKPKGLLWRALLPGLLLTATGVVLMMAGSFRAHPDSSQSVVGWTYWRGVGYAVLALVSWTLFALLNSAWLKKHRDIQATDWANWLGVASGLAALLLWSVLGEDVNVLLARKDIGLVAIVFIVTGLGSAWLATVLWNIASRRLSASLCGQLIVAETLFSLLYAFVWAGGWPTPTQWTASVMFVLGIFVSIRAHR